MAASVTTLSTGTAFAGDHASSPSHAVFVAHNAFDDGVSAYGLVGSCTFASLPGSPDKRQCRSCASTTLEATFAIVASWLFAVKAPNIAGSKPADCISHRRWGISALAPSPLSKTHRAAGGRMFERGGRESASSSSSSSGLQSPGCTS